MRRHQRGITTLGWLILLIPVALVFYAGVRLTPVYLNYMKVSHTLDQVVGEVPNETATADGIRNIIGKHMDIDSLDYPDVKDLKVTRVNSVWQIEAASDIRRRCSSSSQSETVEPCSTVPRRLVAPDWNSIASTREVFPVPRCPTTATFRILPGSTAMRSRPPEDADSSANRIPV